MRLKFSIDTSVLEKRLDELKRRAESVSGERQVSFAELFTDAFMRSHTSFGSLQEMVDASPIGSTEALQAALESKEWSDFVAAHSRHRSWIELRDAAVADYYRRALGLDR